MQKREIINILMERDGLTREEARAELKETMAEVRACIARGEFLEAEDVFAEMLGLEPDYLI